jgi:N6-adenosine-specific RNA methylase IME4
MTFSDFAQIPRGRYGAILCDYPAEFKTWSAKGTGRSAEQHYALMPAEDVRQLPVAELAAKDCALFFWFVKSNLPEALAIVDAWGFVYKTLAFTWVKHNPVTGLFPISMGMWTRTGSEQCILATRGAPKRLGVREVVLAPRREHSRKPEEIYPAVESLVSGPYLELFARQSRAGWDCRGNQTDHFAASTPPPRLAEYSANNAA